MTGSDARTIIRVQGGRASGTEIRVPIGELIIGRRDRTDISFGRDPLLSPQHAKITSYPTGLLLVEDLGSAGGTILNGDRIIGPKQMDQGDVIVVGSTTLIVDLAPSREPGPPSESTVASGSPRGRSSRCTQDRGSLPVATGNPQPSGNPEGSSNDEFVQTSLDSGSGPGRA